MDFSGNRKNEGMDSKHSPEEFRQERTFEFEKLSSDQISELLIHKLFEESKIPQESDPDIVTENKNHLKRRIVEIWKELPSCIGTIENQRKRTLETKEISSSKKRKGKASNGIQGTCFLIEYPDVGIILVSSGHFFEDVIDGLSISSFEEAFSEHVLKFGNLSGELSLQGIRPLQHGQPMFFNDFLQEFNVCGWMCTDGKYIANIGWL